MAGIEPTPARSGRAGHARLNLSATAGFKLDTEPTPGFIVQNPSIDVFYHQCSGNGIPGQTTRASPWQCSAGFELAIHGHQNGQLLPSWSSPGSIEACLALHSSTRRKMGPSDSESRLARCRVLPLSICNGAHAERWVRIDTDSTVFDRAFMPCVGKFTTRQG